MIHREQDKTVMLALLMYEHIIPITAEEYGNKYDSTKERKINDYGALNAFETSFTIENKVYHCITMQDTKDVYYFTTFSKSAIQRLRDKIK